MSPMHSTDMEILARCKGDKYADGGGDIRRRDGWVHIGGDTVFGIVRGGTVVYDHRSPSQLEWTSPVEEGLVAVGFRGYFVGKKGFKSAVQIWDWNYGRSYSSYNEPGWYHLGEIKGDNALHLFVLPRIKNRHFIAQVDGRYRLRIKLWVEPNRGGEHYHLTEVVVYKLEKVIVYEPR